MIKNRFIIFPVNPYLLIICVLESCWSLGGWLINQVSTLFQRIQTHLRIFLQHFQHHQPLIQMVPFDST